MKRILFLGLLLFATSGLAAVEFSKEQIKNIAKAYEYGKTVVADDGMTFEVMMAGILYAESSGGINTADKLFDSIGAFQIRPLVAKELIEEHLPQYHWLLKNDGKLLNMLLNDFDFSLELAGVHIKVYYNEALQRGKHNPWVRTLSRYNGGWNNKTYINRVLRKIWILRKYGVIEK